ncbi:MAG: TetR/AcrR family transcriptional regulator [Acidobacteriota bacterium]
MEKALRRDLLLQAAERVFGKHPFHEATMQEVSAEAQIGMQGVYEHFPSKQRLYEEVILYRAQSFQSRITRALEGLDNPLDELKALIEVRVESFHEAPEFLPVFLKERLHYDWDFKSRFGRRIDRVYREERERVLRIIQRGLDRGLFRDEDPEFLVQFFWDATQAALYYHRKFRPNEEISECVERAVQGFLRGVGGQ